MEKLRVALYARVASADQFGTVLDLQERMLETYAKEQGYEVVAKVRETGSGLCCNRPGLNWILEMPCQEVQGVLIKSLDRVGRDPVETVGWKRQLEASGKSCFVWKRMRCVLHLLIYTNVWWSISRRNKRGFEGKSCKMRDFVLLLHMGWPLFQDRRKN